MRGSTRPQTSAVAAGRISAEDLAEHRDDSGPITDVRHVVANSHNVGEAGTGFAQRLLDVAEDLARLLGRVFGDRHRRVVEPGRAGDKDPLAVDDGSAVPGRRLEPRARGDQAAHFKQSPCTSLPGLTRQSR